MNRFAVLFGIAGCFLAVMSCGSAPERDAPAEIFAPDISVHEFMPAPEPVPAGTVEAPAIVVSREEFNSAMTDVRAFIMELNGIVRRQDYSGWVAHLSPSYFNRINSREFLENLNSTSALRSRNITLRNAKDYFTHVVVPSRQNDHIDDIEFISRQRVKAFTIVLSQPDERGQRQNQRVRLYELENTAGGWRIVN